MSILHFYHKDYLTPNFRLIEYTSVSTLDQNTNLQTDALKIAGCQKIFIDKISGVKTEHPELNKLKEQLREGGHPGSLAA